MSAPVGFETQWAVRAVDEIVRDSERLRQIKRLLAASPNDLALHMSMIRELDQIVIRCSTDRIRATKAISQLRDELRAKGGAR
jgi:hypothetical protein